MGIPEVAGSQFPSSCPLFVMDTGCFLSERYYDRRNIATPLNEQSLLVDTNRNYVITDEFVVFMWMNIELHRFSRSILYLM